MSELDKQKYVPELDHYLEGVNYHLSMVIYIDKFLLDSYKGDNGALIDHRKHTMAQALGETIRDKKFDDCLIEENTMVNGCLVRRLGVNIWVFSKAELEQFKEEIRAEALSGK